MDKRYLTLLSVFLLALLCLSFLAACGTSANGSGSSPTATTVPTIDAAQAQTVMQTQCARCHPITRVTSKQKTAAEWQVTVQRMIQHGALLSPQQEQNLISYLAQNY